jgi:predicted O-linked N-acetylglucosamine transferase (SPINDLY family)
MTAGSVRSERHASNTARLLHDAERAHRAHRFEEARSLFQEILQTDPLQPYAWRGLAMLAWHGGALDTALSLLAKAVELAPDVAVFRWQFGCALQEKQRFAAAEEQFQAACRLRPDAAQYWEDLGIVQQALGETAHAAQAYRRAYDLQPSLARRLKQATLVSPVSPSRDAIVAERQHFHAAMDALLAEPAQSAADPMRMALWPNFHWAYHGQCNRGLQTKAAAVYRHLFPSLDHVAAHCRSPRRVGEKIRVGLISQFFYNHSIGRTSRGLFAQLSRERLDVTAIFIAPAVDDQFSRFIREHAQHSVDVPRDLPSARGLIEAQELDVLFYQDIGMDPFSYFLAFSRLAPVQCVSFGHPDTTGIPTIDYFISNDLYEIAGAEAHYSERLFLLRNLGSLAYYYRTERAGPQKDRSSFGLSDEEHLYVCPQNLFKFHPDMDELIAGILRRDARGKLVLINGRIEHWTDLLKRRWETSAPDVMDRIVFLPRMDSEDFVNLIAVSDVMLDTLYFNGMNTSLDAFAVGTPIVTWPGPLQRGRHTQAMYRKMGLTECIVDHAQAYIDLAVRLAGDAGHRAAMKSEILERNAALFEDIQVVREFERFFQETAFGA